MKQLAWFTCKAFAWGMFALGICWFFLVLYLLIVEGGPVCELYG